MLAIPHLSQVSSMAEIDSKEAQKKSMAGIRALKSLTKETQERRAEDLALSINRRLSYLQLIASSLVPAGRFVPAGSIVPAASSSIRVPAGSIVPAASSSIVPPFLIYVEQEGGIVEQHPVTNEETRAYHESLFHNLTAEVEKVNTVNHKMKETNVELTTELARCTAHPPRGTLRDGYRLGGKEVLDFMKLKPFFLVILCIENTDEIIKAIIGANDAIASVEYLSLPSSIHASSVYTDSEPGRVFWGAGEELSDEGSPRVIVYGYDGLPIQPVAPPSLDNVPGPEHPPSPAEVPYIPEPEYPKYLVPSDDEEPMEDQPLPANASPLALSPGYVVDSDLEEDPKEDSEEDHADYPANGGDDDDEPSNDDDDDDDDTGDEDEEPFEDEEDDE
ncbi:hypothetical protein Tco_0272549 [Tanacetum coccineum]